MRPRLQRLAFILFVALSARGVLAQSSPSITALTPTGGSVGSSVTVTGAGFGAAQGTSTVTFNGVAGTPTNWNDTGITVPVPVGATSGNVVVTVNSVASNGMSFTIVASCCTPTPGVMSTARTLQTATLLNNAIVLLTGGADSNYNALSSAEIYDPTAGGFTSTGGLNTARYLHAATLLNNGMVLITGGVNTNYTPLASAETYNPATQTFTSTGNLNTPRVYHTATLLSNGTVLLAGGMDPLIPLSPPQRSTIR